jgi:hypothetical protein
MYEFSDPHIEERFWFQMQGLAANAASGDMDALHGLACRVAKLSQLLGNATNQTNGAGHNNFGGSGGAHSHTFY